MTKPSKEQIIHDLAIAYATGQMPWITAQELNDEEDAIQLLREYNRALNIFEKNYDFYKDSYYNPDY